MAVGEFINTTNYRHFEHIGRQVIQMADMDPAMVFQTALPGFLDRVFTNVGQWPGAEQKGFEFPSKNNGAKSVAPNERAVRGGYDKKQIVALPGWEIAGETQTVLPSDFQRGGMTTGEVARRVMRPRLDWNKTVFTAAMDVVTAKGKSTGAPVDNGAYVIADQHGNSVTKALITNSADVCSDTIANSSQSILFPLRDGTETAANHDHTIQAAGASWTLALARTHRDLILEHPGNGTMVDAYVGKTNAEDIRAVMKSELGAVVTREEFIRLNIPGAGGLGGAIPLTMGLEGVNYWYCPDMDTEQALYVAEGKKPFYASFGVRGSDGAEVGTGAWFEQENPETRGGSYGYRAHQNMGCMDPTSAVIVDYV
jgi:hypothetical protein